eukprot:TRINITY_DN42869_c0_g1_i1.p1 TRINITY_DN42869_c0_g1~~TRINITY_DN42869_c0_g1_i1.p1  ORF type:complete len:162 (+),score=17.83 TRINITY_DN42869_c0_g1_i1:124-609(+)
MWGLRLMNNNYLPSSDGKDIIFLKNKEYELGRLDPYRAPTAYEGRTCKLRQFKIGPKPPGKARVDQLTKGQWACSGQWSSSAKSTKSLQRSSSAPVMAGQMERPRGYKAAMDSWLEDKQSQMFRTPASLETWRQQGCSLDDYATFVRGGTLLPPLYQEPAP